MFTYVKAAGKSLQHLSQFVLVVVVVVVMVMGMGMAVVVLEMSGCLWLQKIRICVSGLKINPTVISRAHYGNLSDRIYRHGKEGNLGAIH
ncbi:hypothetical protein BOTCAL_0004g00180 [Botryotinia calthae]|uniref:Uncharacterized protein n=1 Tax=Botryotinia calthae TaxID=38488 RepID=A0A4Y8DHR4_9HELO|nr:hypothetical protein BOTCAL_0004g00180 [Botryotinia calthae]